MKHTGRGMTERKSDRLKRIAALLVLAVMLLAAVPAAFADQNEQVEGFTAERTESGITVTLPAGYADKGYFKLFWKNEGSGDVRNAVIPVDTPSYQIEAEEGTEYSFQLFYAKKRGLLPSAWKEEPDPKGPAVWKVLWIDAQTIDFLGITNRMTEEDHRISEDASKDFEALIEEYTDGLVDIQISRMTLEEPITSMAYYPKDGYDIEQTDFDMIHYGMRKYDSIFLFGRMDHIRVKYNGFACPQKNSREEPLYSFIRLAGETCLPQDEAAIKYVCVHEFLHQLGFFYKTYQLEIPDPDTPEKYGYEPAPGGTLDPQFFRDALTMKAVTEDGRYAGVPAEAWEYKPTRTTVSWDLSFMQDGEVPAELRWRKEEPAETAEPAGNAYDPEIFGILDEFRYENKVMGIGCTLDNWGYLTPEEYYAREKPAFFISGDDAETYFTDGVMVKYAESYEKPVNVMFTILYPSDTFAKQYDETAYLEQTMELLEQGASGLNLADYTCGIVQCRIGNRTLPGIKSSYLLYGVKTYQLTMEWLDGDHMNTVEITSYMSDECESVLEHFFLLDQ